MIGRRAGVCAIVAIAGRVLAGDGVLEINQASVSGATGVLHVISTPGSYRLTSDLLAPNGLDGIRIDASDVTLDLNGFSVSSQGAFALATHGITGTGLSNVEIRDGTVRGFPTSGVHLPGGQLHRVIDVRALGNGTFGINLEGNPPSGGHLVRGCTALGNATGIRVLPDGSLVLDSVARSNTGTGLLLGAGVGYERNAATGNGTDVTGGGAIGCNLIGSSPVCPP